MTTPKFICASMLQHKTRTIIHTYMLGYNVQFVTFNVTDIIFFVQIYIFRHYDYSQLIETV